MIEKIYSVLIINKTQSYMKFLNGGSTFYQSLKELNLKGYRDTDERFEKYGLKKILKKEHKVLDIGCNKGFFSIITSRFVKQVIGIDNKFLNVKIGKVAQKKLNIINLKLIKEDFKNFKTNMKYDVIYSFAIHHWIGMPFDDYIKKIDSILNTNGYVVFESHDLDSLDLYIEPKLDIFKELGFEEINRTNEYENGKRVCIIYCKKESRKTNRKTSSRK